MSSNIYYGISHHKGLINIDTYKEKGKCQKVNLHKKKGNLYSFISKK